MLPLNSHAAHVNIKENLSENAFRSGLVRAQTSTHRDVIEWLFTSDALRVRLSSSASVRKIGTKLLLDVVQV